MNTPPAPVAATPAASPPKGFDRLDFLWKTHSYLNDYIRFADTKATVVLAMSTALIGAMVGRDALAILHPDRFTLDRSLVSARDTAAAGFAAASLVLLIRALYCAFMTTSPRLWSVEPDGRLATLKHMLWVDQSKAAHAPGLVYWREILAHGSGDAYWRSLSATQQADAEEYMAKRLHTLAGVADSKFLYATRAMYALVVGAIGAGFLMLVLLRS